MLSAACWSCSGEGKYEGVKDISLDLETLPVDTIEILPSQVVELETSDSSLLYDVSHLAIADNKFFVISAGLAKMFDASDGSYLGSFARMGQGPGEYTRVTTMWSTDSTVNLLNADKSEILQYSFDGKFLNSKSKDKNDDQPTEINYIMPNPDGGYFVIGCYVGRPSPLYYLFDDEIKMVKIIPGRELVDGGYTSDRMTYDTKRKRALGWEMYKDTLFEVTENGVLPIYAFDFGKDAAPKELQSNPEMFTRSRMFRKDGEALYTGMLKNYQVAGDDLFFTFISNNKSKGYLGRLDLKTGNAKAYVLHSADDRFVRQGFFKIIDGNLVFSLTDRQNPDNNPAILIYPLAQLPV